MKDPIKLKDLVIEKLSLAEIMLSYNVQFQFDPRNASEVQFKCPFHGRDNKPSARLYSATKSCFCWVCRKSWNVVSFIMDKESMPFKDAVNYLIKKYSIDTSSIPENLPIEIKQVVPLISEKNILMDVIKRNIIELRKKITFEKYLALCAAFQLIRFRDSQGLDVLESLNKIGDKVKLCQQ